MMTDPIADMLTRIRNANVAMHDQVRMPSSKQKVALAQLEAGDRLLGLGDEWLLSGDLLEVAHGALQQRRQRVYARTLNLGLRCCF